ncbi:MAG: DNA adenine methylase [Peptococcaceae bacterium]|nr:DNA adenine methylase [Peptococcaceae bacterium]
MKNNYGAMQHSRCFVYIDPPYYEQGKSLYRHYYSDKDHQDLAEFIAHCTYPWLISYDDHPFISDLYFNDQTHIQGLYRDYSVGSQHKRARELLISNMRIPPTRIFRYSVVVAND